MTQDDLAQKLSISKSAVSQNLNGRSSFDLQNLLAIAEMFHLSIDDLLSRRSHSDVSVISEYEKAVLRGVDEFRKVRPQDLNIKDPDMYGKVLVEYAIKHKKIDVFQYLDDSEVPLVNDFYHRSKEVYLSIIRFILEERLSNALKYIIKYAELNTVFAVEDEVLSENLWRLIDQEHNKALINSMFEAEYKAKGTAFSLFEYEKKIKIKTKAGWLETIAKHRLVHVLNEYLETKLSLGDYPIFMEIMLKHRYYEAIKQYIERFVKKKLNTLEVFAYDVQRIIQLAAKSNDVAVINIFLQKELFADLTEIVCESVRQKQEAIVDHILSNYAEFLIYRRVGRAAVDVRNTALLQRINEKLFQPDLDYLYGVAQIDDYDSLTYLVHLGAKLNGTEFNNETIQKTNQLLHHLASKERKFK
jgi:transcriptional regulator with XRE-family HTH domain